LDGELSEEDSGIEVGTFQQEFLTVPLEERRASTTHNAYEGYIGSGVSYMNSPNASPDDVFAYTIRLTHSGSVMEPYETATIWVIKLVYSTKSVGYWIGLQSKSAPATKLNQPDDVPMSKA